MFPKLPLSLSIFLVLLAGSGHAQNSSVLGSYPSVSVKIPLSSKWNIYGNSEMRSIDLFDRYYHIEIKAGFSYKYTKALVFTFAGGFYQNYHGGHEFENVSEEKDYRIWQQVEWKHRLSFLNIQHRLRIEEVVTKNFKVIARYRPQISVPLNKETLAAGTFYIVANDEVFMKADKPVLDKNRIFLGLGYQVSETVGLQSGILRQVDYKFEGENRGNNFLYIQCDLKL